MPPTASLEYIKLVAEVILALTAVAATLWAARIGVRKMFKTLAAIRTASEAFLELPQHMPHLRQLAALSASIQEIRHQVTHNGGGSMKDQVVETKNMVQRLSGTFRAHLDNDDNMARFEWDPNGALTWITGAFFDWTGSRNTNAAGFGWLTSVAPEDRERVRNEIMACVADGRGFRLSFGLLTEDDNWIPVEGYASPVRHPSTLDVMGWAGALRRPQPATSPYDPMEPLT